MLVAAFEEAHPGIALRAVTGGTGEILEYARRGDVDVTITHDPAAESAFVAQGHGRVWRPLMYNDFILVGPADDPASLRGAHDAVDAFNRLDRAGAPFVSRGDDSGTHRRERAVWRESGIEPNRKAWYIEAGSGMGDALRLANSRHAYVLTDRGTFLTLQNQLDLHLLFEGDQQRLTNRYGVMVVNNARQPAAADSLLEWLTGTRGKQVIAEYGAQEYGRPLFNPMNEDER